MKPSQIAKQLGAKTLSEVARAYDVHDAHLVQVNKADPERFIKMVKVHVLAKELNADTKYLDFMLERVVGNVQNTNAADYFTEYPEAREELTRAYVVDFRVRVKDMCQKMLDSDTAQLEFGELVLGLVGGKE
ncbi:hypothetical protein MYOV065v1_p0022 [Vibrio phage PS15B.2]|nr:hypothetical protein MYOV065v1_p0022 [Vibrio phage PS15B.2]QZI90840.1 hypothetical protein MYOV066v1_p0062 [Vibrio phage PS15B.3]QZI90872.1 hypothetical protein MYOV064v1_p0022 [Vibrio phage PS15B.4]